MMACMSNYKPVTAGECGVLIRLVASVCRRILVFENLDLETSSSQNLGRIRISRPYMQGEGHRSETPVYAFCSRVVRLGLKGKLILCIKFWLELLHVIFFLVDVFPFSFVCRRSTWSNSVWLRSRPQLSVMGKEMRRQHGLLSLLR